MRWRDIERELFRLYSDFNRYKDLGRRRWDSRLVFMKFTKPERHYNATCQAINLEQVLGIVSILTRMMASPSIPFFYLYPRVTQKTAIRPFQRVPESGPPITYKIAKYDISITHRYHDIAWRVSVER